MIKLVTEVPIEKFPFSLDYTKKLIFAGSCFAENISQYFINAKFNCLINPSGIVYNPLSLKMMVDNVLAAKQFNENDFFFDGVNYNCFDFHSSFSSVNLEDAISKVNSSIKIANDFLIKSDYFFITLGTAFVYFLKENLQPVSNCHKQNQNIFSRRMISIKEISDALSLIVENVTSINPKIKFIFTVSPIRHVADGLHNNQLSKSSLHLGINEVLSKYQNCFYFPSYEIVIDELRDYRFYSDDLVHVSNISEKIIWQRLQETLFSKTLISDISRVERFMQSVNHKILNPTSTQTQVFCKQSILKAKSLMSEIQGLNLENEIKYFSTFVC